METPENIRLDAFTRRVNRRRFLAWFSAAGLGTTLLPGVLWSRLAAAQDTEITTDMIADAEKLAGLEFTQEERELMANGLNSRVEDYAELRNVSLPNSVPPAVQFNPQLPGMRFDSEQESVAFDLEPVPEVPSRLEDVAFWPVTKLARALKARRIRSVELTRMYLDRLRRFDPILHCVITLTEDRAIKQAEQADREMDDGEYRGPLHGVPWGAKDLLATKGYPTTWGAQPYKDQVIDEDATVVRRLDEAGAVLVAKLTLGALAMGDVWYGERTRNPWNPERGSSGSSAGPASAVAAGLVGFAIGSETNGSIASPSNTCGVTGLRPTFGRVSRHGAMALSWSLDKLGPIARSVEDCALVLAAIHGSDDLDPTAVTRAFNWNPDADISRLRIGYVRDAFETEQGEQGLPERSLDQIRQLGFDLTPVEWPDYPTSAMFIILNVEAAAAFDNMTRNNRDDELKSQAVYSWPNRLREARFVPAVEYVQANRVRTKLMQDVARAMEHVDVVVTPTFNELYMGNLTGHPLIVVPNGLDDRGMPRSIGLLGHLYGEADLCAVAHALQRATDHHKNHPDLEA